MCKLSALISYSVSTADKVAVNSQVMHPMNQILYSGTGRPNVIEDEDWTISSKAWGRFRSDDPYFRDDDVPPLPSASTFPDVRPPKSKREIRIPTGNETHRLLKKAIAKDAEETLDIGRHWHIARRMKPLGFSQRHRLHAINPWAGETWAGLVEQSLDELDARDGAYFVTVLCEDWDFETDQEWHNSDDLTQRLKLAQRTVRNHLRGLNFFLQLDVGLHRYARSYGRRVCVHFHGIVWGSRAEVQRAMRRFHPGYSGARGGQAKPVETWPGTMRYITKDTRAAYVSFKRNVWSVGRERPRVFSYREPLTRENRRFLLGLFGSLTKPELCLGSGKGAEVLRRARQLANANGWRRSR
jgi:hypothetical protein